MFEEIMEGALVLTGDRYCQDCFVLATDVLSGEATEHRRKEKPCGEAQGLWTRHDGFAKGKGTRKRSLSKGLVAFLRL